MADPQTATDAVLRRILELVRHAPGSGQWSTLDLIEKEALTALGQRTIVSKRGGEPHGN